MQMKITHAQIAVPTILPMFKIPIEIVKIKVVSRTSAPLINSARKNTEKKFFIIYLSVSLDRAADDGVFFIITQKPTLFNK